MQYNTTVFYQELYEAELERITRLQEKRKVLRDKEQSVCVPASLESIVAKTNGNAPIDNGNEDNQCELSFPHHNVELSQELLTPIAEVSEISSSINVIDCVGYLSEKNPIENFNRESKLVNQTVELSTSEGLMVVDTDQQDEQYERMSSWSSTDRSNDEVIFDTLPPFEWLPTSDQLGSFPTSVHRMSVISEGEGQCSARKTSVTHEDCVTKFQKSDIADSVMSDNIEDLEEEKAEEIPLENDAEPELTTSGNGKSPSDHEKDDSDSDDECVDEKEYSNSLNEEKCSESESGIDDGEESKEVDERVRFLEPLFKCKHIPEKSKDRQGMSRGMYNLR